MPKYDNSERLSTVSDQDWCEELDETYEMVMRLVSDDKELTVYVEAADTLTRFRRTWV